MHNDEVFINFCDNYDMLRDFKITNRLYPKFTSQKKGERMSKIKSVRLAAGLTQDSMSKKLGIPKRTIQDWETQRRNPPDYVERLVVDELKRTIKNNALRKPLATIKKVVYYCHK